MAIISKELEESLKNLNNFKPELLDSLIREAVNTFHSIKDKADSKDPKDVEKAMESALSLRDSLENKLNSILDSMGIDMDELKTFMSEPSNFTPEEQTLMKQIDEQFKQLAPAPEKAERSPQPVKKKKKTTPWIAG